jgi:hypothetical protein
MSDRPRKPFHDAVHNLPPAKEEQKRDPIRDKDNASYTIKPPSWGIAGTSRHAPRGASGTRRNLPTPDHQKARKEVKPKVPGDLKREFKPIVRNTSKDRGRDR